jgi:hypothetical protein
MFFVVLVLTLAVSLATALLIDRLFAKPLEKILDRLVSSDLAAAWQKYVRFAIYVVGVSGGVSIYQLEQYITPQGSNENPVALTASHATLEVYRTVIKTAQSVAWMLLVFFVAALIAYVVLRGFELRRGKGAPAEPQR